MEPTYQMEESSFQKSFKKEVPSPELPVEYAAWFQKSWSRVASHVHRVAREKGFHPVKIKDMPRRNAERIALVHSELSEALEAVRQGNKPDDKVKEYSGAEVELADAVIRIMDLAMENDWDVAGAMIKKIEYNRHRSRMHGGKLF